MSTYEVTTDDGHVYQVETVDAVQSNPEAILPNEPGDEGTSFLQRLAMGSGGEAVTDVLPYAQSYLKGTGDLLDLAKYANPNYISEKVASAVTGIPSQSDAFSASQFMTDVAGEPEFKTTTGKIIGKGVEAIPMSALGGGPLAAGLMGIGSEAMHQAAPDSAVAPIAGAILAGSAPGLFRSVPGIFKAAIKALLPTAKAQALPAAEQGAKLLSELKGVAPGTFEDSLTTDARNQLAAESISTKADAAQQAASEAFANVPDAQVNIRPVRNYIARDLAAKEGLLNPDSQSRQIVQTLDEMMPAKQKIPIPEERVLNENNWPMSQRNPKTGQMEPVMTGGGFRTVTPPAMVSLQKAQNILRDIGEAGTKAKGTWESTSLWGAKRSLTNAIERQLPEDASGALMDARKAWAEYKNMFDEGAAGAVRDVVENPDKRLDVFYSKLTQDTKTAGQLMKVMSPEEVSNAQTLMLQEMMKKQPVSWGKHLNDNLGVFETVFGKDGAQNLSKWANASEGSVSKFLLSRPTSLGRQLTLAPVRLGVGALFGGPVGSVLAESGGVLRDQSLKVRQRELGGLLARFAAGDKEAAVLLSKPATKENVASIIPSILNFAARGSAIGMQNQGDNSQNSQVSQPSSVNPSVVKPDRKAVEARIDADPYYSALYSAESGRNPDAKNPKSSAKGGFQFIDSTAAKLGLKDPMDLAASFDAVQKLTKEHKAAFGDKPEMLYAAHYLGATVLSKVLQGKPLNEKEQGQVAELETDALPRFMEAYNQVVSNGEA